MKYTDVKRIVGKLSMRTHTHVTEIQQDQDLGHVTPESSLMPLP
jgi:hypothetical protein